MTNAVVVAAGGDLRTTYNDHDPCSVVRPSRSGVVEKRAVFAARKLASELTNHLLGPSVCGAIAARRVFDACA